MVQFAGTYALANYGVDTLVMLADPNYHAAKIYESVGFSPTEHTVQLTRRSPDD